MYLRKKEKVCKKIDEKQYREVINKLINENKDLEEQLEYADKQLDDMCNTIYRLEDYIYELNDKLIREITR